MFKQRQYGTSGDVMPADTASSETADMGIYDFTLGIFWGTFYRSYTKLACLDLVYIAERTLNTNIPTQLNAWR